ncbi:hypothetical protein RJ640_027886 [Escallonia rubra]|uniref:Uncharacterized protein n=1 Tax=Escallonia rubra TaxID=112253 RepID=A0AA88UJQ2_9ASTE|nr:hypothetical protein RJ640_027886 [Escallonia rubra]
MSFVGISPFVSPNSIPKLGQIKAAEEAKEIRVCVNRSCRRQGSMDTLQILSGIAPPGIAVTSCGCLGRCGAGPNLVLLPAAAFVGHCATAARAANVECPQALPHLPQALRPVCTYNYVQAIDLKPYGGMHITYKNRSTARLAMGNTSGALEDVKEALIVAPNYPEYDPPSEHQSQLAQAYVCEGDALMAMEQFDLAGKAYMLALELDPFIRRSKSFKARIALLQDKLDIIIFFQARIALLQDKLTAARVCICGY